MNYERNKTSRRSSRNPINFVHAIHICNFVFAIRRHGQSKSISQPIHLTVTLYSPPFSPAPVFLQCSPQLRAFSPSPFPFHVRWQPIFIPVIAFAIPMRNSRFQSRLSDTLGRFFPIAFALSTYRCSLLSLSLPMIAENDGRPRGTRAQVCRKNLIGGRRTVSISSVKKVGGTIKFTLIWSTKDFGSRRNKGC